jgi:HAD superfamily hydrolase (TIGR01484 family)
MRLVVPARETSPPLPGLVATDLDGTLVRSDGTVSAYTAEVLAELDRRGVAVVFVTGRPLRWAREVFSYVGSHGLAIVSNGALVWDVAEDRPWLARPMAPRVSLEVARALREAIPSVRFAVETVDGWAM